MKQYTLTRLIHACIRLESCCLLLTMEPLVCPVSPLLQFASSLQYHLLCFKLCHASLYNFCHPILSLQFYALFGELRCCCRVHRCISTSSTLHVLIQFKAHLQQAHTHRALESLDQLRYSVAYITLLPSLLLSPAYFPIYSRTWSQHLR